MNEKQKGYDGLNRRVRRWKRINNGIDMMILAVLLTLIAFTGAGLAEGAAFLEEGMGNDSYCGFSLLKETNPDVMAWLTLGGTHIDHPVVKSADNFDYLDKGFDGSDYAGGTLFLDMNNTSFEDPYCVIHGHHMAGGAMFGDLEKYLDGDFFEKNRTGTLLTPEYDYDLEVFAAGTYDAYDRNIYGTGGTFSYGYVRETAVNCRGPGAYDHVLALSTCADDMTDDRIVVFCSLINQRKHE